jgi:CheY-like chemotaxis protein
MPPLESLAPRLRGEFRESVAARSPADNPLRVLFADAMDVQPYIAVLGTRFQSTHARSVAAATRLLRDLQPDILVADIGLPHMDGFELIARVRHSDIDAVRMVPAIAVTAYARSEDRAKALTSGYQRHLAKPIDPGELLSTVAMFTRAADGSVPTPT